MPQSSRRVPNPLCSAPALITALCCVLFVLAAPVAPAAAASALADEGADEQDWPEPQAIFDEYIQAIGGEEAVRAHTARIIEATISGQDDYFALMTMWQRAPRQIRIRVEAPGTPRQEIHFDGDYAWVRIGERPHQLMAGRQLLDLWETADFYADAAPDERYRELETIGIETFDGYECYAVRYVSKVNKPGVLFFDINDGLLRGQRTFQADGDDWQALVVYRRDYREQEGVLYPMTYIQETSAGRTSIRYQSIRINPERMPSFEMPSQLRRELEQMRREQPETPEMPETEDLGIGGDEGGSGNEG